MSNLPPIALLNQRSYRQQSVDFVRTVRYKVRRNHGMLTVASLFRVAHTACAAFHLLRSQEPQINTFTIAHSIAYSSAAPNGRSGRFLP